MRLTLCGSLMKPLSAGRSPNSFVQRTLVQGKALTVGPPVFEGFMVLQNIEG